MFVPDSDTLERSFQFQALSDDERLRSRFAVMVGA
jgi:hypothetical protein